MGKNYYKTYVGIGLTAAAVCLFLLKFDAVAAVVSVCLSAASPLFLGCVIAYVVNLLMKLLERFYFPGTKRGAVQKSRRPVCIVLSFALLFVLLFLLVKLVVPELLSSFRLITDEIPPFMEAIRLWAVDYSDELPALQTVLAEANINWQEAVKKTVDVLAAGAGGLFSSVLVMLTGLFGAAAKLLVGVIFAIYLLSSKERLSDQADRIMRAFLKPQARKKVLYVAGVVHETFSNFIVGQCAEAVVIGSLCTLGMVLLRLPYAVMTGVVVGVTALVPVVGAYLGAAVGAFMVFTVNPVQAVMFLAFLVLLQQLEGNLIYPRVVGSSIGLPGIWVLAAVTVGGGILGIGGMLLGVPLVASAYKLMGAAVKKRLEANS
ncbi:MAG: AI-2E family transporter [Lachnospiraceae bacterium]|jgi:predicted PurR-regulated permease PerM|nr:AI-2E family transporter [Lachnospiraceae bacterium]